jgi:large subunit ribosomal protein L30
MPQKKIKVTLIHSTNRRIQKHKDCVIGLGLRRRHQMVELLDTPEVRGMIHKVSYLLKVEEV